MTLRELLESLPERLQRGAHVKAVFGEPILAQGKTLVPVARVGYGFGGGMTRKTSKTADVGEEDGGGLGGGVGVVPIGLVEVTERTTRFIPFRDNRAVMGSFFLGCCLGYLLAGRIQRPSLPRRREPLPEQ